MSHRLAPQRHAWLHVAEGAVQVNGHILAEGDALALSAETAIELQAQQPSQVLLFDLN